MWFTADQTDSASVDLAITLCVFVLERLLTSRLEPPNHTCCLVLDLLDCRWSQADVEVCEALASFTQHYLPGCLECAYVIAPSKLPSKRRKLVHKAFCLDTLGKRKLIRLSSVAELSTYFDRALVPVTMGGNNEELLQRDYLLRTYPTLDLGDAPSPPEAGYGGAGALAGGTTAAAGGTTAAPGGGSTGAHSDAGAPSAGRRSSSFKAGAITLSPPSSTLSRAGASAVPAELPRRSQVPTTTQWAGKTVGFLGSGESGLATAASLSAMTTPTDEEDFLSSPSFGDLGEANGWVQAVRTAPSTLTRREARSNSCAKTDDEDTSSLGSYRARTNSGTPFSVSATADERQKIQLELVL
jgi:CRAL/TRIO domain